MKIAGSGNYLYCDTDSLIVNKVGLKKLRPLVHDSNLGSMKVEAEVTSLNIRGLKDYMLGTKSVIKGIRKNAIETGDGVFTQQLWPSLKGLLRSGNISQYRIETIQKILTRKYKKGRVSPDGTVRPLVLDEAALLVLPL
ncbi:unnamed protein product [marine sediment metagenome]|uniref:Uncharacterized protein n=1 Tax=marine sediment metagenome TaxID=412755 RepID=X1QUL6_9ZZZZ